MNRRRLLHAIGGSMVFLAGCSDEKDENEGVILRSLTIGNHSYEPRNVTVVLLYNDEHVLSDVYKIEPRDGNVVGGREIEIPSQSEPGDIEIRIASGEQIRYYKYPDDTDIRCIEGRITISEGGRVSFGGKHDENGYAKYFKTTE